VLDLLADYAKEHYVAVEYGIESCHDRTLRLVNRSHDFACPEAAIRAAVEGQDYEYIAMERSQTMKETVKIEGMMCPHCEARVKAALEAIEQVESAEVSHKKGTAKVKLTQDVPFETLKSAVEEAGYKVVE
jgi:copper chaperone CopZ